jgi:hypothetical protein
MYLCAVIAPFSTNTKSVWASKNIPAQIIILPPLYPLLGYMYRSPGLRHTFSQPSGDLGLNLDSSVKSTFFHSLSPQFTYWCANSSPALRCPTVNLGPVAGVFADKPLSFSLLRTVVAEIITPRTSANRPTRIVDGNPLSRNTKRHKKLSSRSVVDLL